jgi:hypothetical protein
MDNIENDPIENSEDTTKENPTSEDITKENPGLEGRLNENTTLENPTSEGITEENEEDLYSLEDMLKIVMVIPLSSQYSSPNHLEYNSVIYGICVRNMSTTIPLPLIETYKEKIDQEESVQMWIKRSDYTKRKKEADLGRDKSFRGLMSFVRVNTKNFDPVKQESASHVYDLLLGYKTIPQMDYDKETNEIKKVVAHLRSDKYRTEVENLELSGWISDLESWNNLFIEYVNYEYEELKTKPDVTLIKARKDTDIALKAILDRVRGLINLNLGANVANFVKEFNIPTSHYNNIVKEHYGRLHAKTDVSNADVETVSDQEYIGEEINFIPRVSIQKKDAEGNVITVRLKFSVDFIVTYKDNVGPGTATIIIHGIGKYMGERVTTFNIKRDL